MGYTYTPSTYYIAPDGSITTQAQSYATNGLGESYLQNNRVAQSWEVPEQQRLQDEFSAMQSNGYIGQYIPLASNGADNKYQFVQSLINQGAVYADGTPVTMNDAMWGKQVYIPPGGSANAITPAVDNNPSESWAASIPIEAMTLAAMGGMLGAGMSSGLGMIGDTAGIDAAAAGDALSGGMSLDPSFSGVGDLYSAITGQSVAPDWYSSLVSGFQNTPLYSAATASPGLWDQAKDFVSNNATSLAKALTSFGSTPQVQGASYMPSIGSASSGGSQPTQTQPKPQQQSMLSQQLSVPQFTQMQSPQQDSNYQAPQYSDQQGSWGQPSIFQLSQSTWNPSMAEALRNHNG